MIFAASWALSARLYVLSQRFAPSDVIIRRVHTRAGLKWGPLIGLGGVVVYGVLMVIMRTIVGDGGPGWVNLFVLVGFWNALRFAWLIPVSLARLLRVRHQEKVLACRWHRNHEILPDPPVAERVDARAPVASAS